MVLADDLTGACDVGVQCLRAGWRVRCVFAGRPDWWRELGHPGVTVLDLDTRRLGARAARRRAAAIGARLRALGRRPAYYKMDSTLRGHFGVELAALRRAGGFRTAWIVPANPAQGRWTVGGRQRVRGVPLERTAFARDPVHPVTVSDVRALAERAFGAGHVGLAALGTVRRGAAAVRRARRFWRGATAAVADAVRDADLAAVAGAVGSNDLPAGAAPFARHVLRRRQAVNRRIRRRVSGDTRWLAVLGSRNPITREQIREVDSAALARILQPRHFPRRLTPATGWRVARDLAARAGRRVARGTVDGLVLSGGITAAAVCAELDISSLELNGEVEPGLALSTARAHGRTLRIVTKPGGFGDRGALRRLLGAGPR